MVHVAQVAQLALAAQVAQVVRVVRLVMMMLMARQCARDTNIAVKGSRATEDSVPPSAEWAKTLQASVFPIARPTFWGNLSLLVAVRSISCTSLNVDSSALLQECCET